MTQTSPVVDARLPQLSGGAGGPAYKVPVHDEAAAHTRAQGQAYQVPFPFSGPQLPFRIGHAVGVILHVHGQSAGGLEHVPHRNVVPSRHVGERVDGSLVKVDEAGHAHADGLHLRVVQPQHVHKLGDGFNQLIRIAVFLGGDGRRVRDHFRPFDDPQLDGGSPEVNADGGDG